MKRETDGPLPPGSGAEEASVVGTAGPVKSLERLRRIA